MADMLLLEFLPCRGLPSDLIVPLPPSFYVNANHTSARQLLRLEAGFIHHARYHKAGPYCGACPLPSHPIRGQASLLLPNFWLSEPRPLPVRVPRPCRSELPPSLRSSPSPAKPLRLRLVVRRTRQPPRRDRQGLAQHMGTGPYAPTEAPVPASSRLLRFPGWER